MASYKSVGFVLHHHNLGEADRILTILTREKGLIRVVAKGVRRSKSKLAGHLEPFIRIQLGCAEGRNLDIITSAQASEFVLPETVDLRTREAAYAISELFMRLLDEGPSDKSPFDLYEASLRGLAMQIDPLLVYNYAGIQLLNLLGHSPDLKVEAADMYFLSFADGIISSTRPTEHYQSISSQQIKLWRLMQQNSLDQIARLTGTREYLAGSTELLEKYIRWQLGVKLRALHVFH